MSDKDKQIEGQKESPNKERRVKVRVVLSRPHRGYQLLVEHGKTALDAYRIIEASALPGKSEFMMSGTEFDALQRPRNFVERIKEKMPNPEDIVVSCWKRGFFGPEHMNGTEVNTLGSVAAAHSLGGRDLFNFLTQE